MAIKSEIRTDVKELIPRAPADIDTLVDSMMKTGIELFGRMGDIVDDEQIWEHTFTSAEVTANANNWLLPSGTRRVISAALIDTSGTDNVEIPIPVKSGADIHTVSQDIPSGANYPGTFPSSGWDFDAYKTRHRGGTRRDGRPRVAYHVKRNIYLWPRPDSTEVDNKLEIFVSVRPAQLATDGASNTITTEMPRAFTHYVAGLVWMRLGSDARMNLEMQIAAKLLEEHFGDDVDQKLFQVREQYIGR